MRNLILCLLTLAGVTSVIYAQENTVTPISVIERSRQTQAPDTIPPIQLDEEELDDLIDLRSQFEKQNSTYSVPRRKGQSLLRFIQKDKLEIPPEVLSMARTAMDASLQFDRNMTFKDTIIVNPIFLPLVFKGYKFPDEPFYDPEKYKPQDPIASLFPKPVVLPKYAAQKKKEDYLYQYMVSNHPRTFRYSERDLPNDRIIPTPIHVNIRDAEKAPITVKSEVNVEDLDAGVIRFIPDRLYWRSAFESAIQFSQNYISHNWHKGGSSNLNVYTKHAVKYDYQKEKIQWTNLMELVVSAYNAPKDTMRNYKIGDDVLRLHSNFGLKAFSQWYYTFDAEFKTQLFKNYQENTDFVQAAFLAPMSINLGLGMKYELEKKFENDKHKKLKLSINMAPISYTYMYSVKDDIDLGRHGFKQDPETEKYKTSLSQVGSTIRTDLSVQFNRNVSWQSRFYYFTSYDRAVGEFENTLTMAISRYFSTRIYLYLRYDDGVAPDKKDTDLGYFQMNELLSFGFNYKW